MLNDIGKALLEGLTPVIIDFVLVLIGVLFTLGTGLLKKFKEYIVSKVGVNNYNRGLAIAKGIYYQIEDEFKDLAKDTEAKIELMESRLLEVIPTLTQVELDAINKQIWNELDKKAKDSGIFDPAQGTAGPDLTAAITEKADDTVELNE